MRLNMLSLTASVTGLFFPITALAHGGHAGDDGLLSGILHPLLGADHLLAMVAVAMWATILRPRRFWLVPLGFMSGMALGALAGMSGIEPPGMEIAIAGSVIVFGLCAALRISPPVALSLAVAGAFGAVHGLAHGLEYAGEPANAGLFMAGMLVATAGLHLAGCALGLAIARTGNPVPARLGGAAFTLAGAVLLAGQVLPV